MPYFTLPAVLAGHAWGHQVTDAGFVSAIGVRDTVARAVGRRFDQYGVLVARRHADAWGRGPPTARDATGAAAQAG